MSESTIKRVETGRADATGEVIVRLADALEVSADYLLGRDRVAA